MPGSLNPDQRADFNRKLTVGHAVAVNICQYWPKCFTCFRPFHSQTSAVRGGHASFSCCYDVGILQRKKLSVATLNEVWDLGPDLERADCRVSSGDSGLLHRVSAYLED